MKSIQIKNKKKELKELLKNKETGWIVKHNKLVGEINETSFGCIFFNLPDFHQEVIKRMKDLGYYHTGGGGYTNSIYFQNNLGNDTVRISDHSRGNGYANADHHIYYEIEYDMGNILNSYVRENYSVQSNTNQPSKGLFRPEIIIPVFLLVVVVVAVIVLVRRRKQIKTK